MPAFGAGPVLPPPPVGVEATARGDFVFRDVAGKVANVAQVPPFWQVKPPAGIDFFRHGTGVLAAGAGSTLETIAAFVVQRDYRAVVASVGIFIDAPTALLAVRWTLLFNGAPVQGADNLRSYPRAANNLSIDFPFEIIAPGGTTVTLRAVNESAAGPWTIGGQVIGWQWPRIVEEQTFKNA